MGVKCRFDLETARCVEKKCLASLSWWQKGKENCRQGRDPTGGRRRQSLAACWHLRSSKLETFAVCLTTKTEQLNGANILHNRNVRSATLFQIKIKPLENSLNHDI